MSAINILLVDDQHLVREGIKSLLALRPGLYVVAEAGDGREALSCLDHHPVDVVLLDIRMPVMSGLEFLASVKESSHVVKVLVLTTFDEHELVLDCLSLGARGYLRKDVTLDALVKAIHTVARGEHWVQPAITERVAAAWPEPAASNAAHTPLSATETQVLQLVAAGYSNEEIARATHKSVGTVRNQVSSILGKLNVRDRTRAVLKAMDMGLLY